MPAGNMIYPTKLFSSQKLSPAFYKCDYTLPFVWKHYKTKSNCCSWVKSNSTPFNFHFVNGLISKRSALKPSPAASVAIVCSAVLRGVEWPRARPGAEWGGRTAGPGPGGEAVYGPAGSPCPGRPVHRPRRVRPSRTVRADGHEAAESADLEMSLSEHILWRVAGEQHKKLRIYRACSVRLWRDRPPLPPASPETCAVGKGSDNWPWAPRGARPLTFPRPVLHPKLE